MTTTAILIFTLLASRFWLTSALISPLPTKSLQLFTPSLKSGIQEAHTQKSSNPRWIDKNIVSWDERVEGLFQRQDPPFVDAYEKLFGVPRHVSRRFVAVAIIEYDDVDELNQWGAVLQGSDVFVKGMGSFDLQLAYNRLVDRRWRHHKESLLEDFLELFNSLPAELEELPVSDLLEGRDHDDLFHVVMATAINDGLYNIRKRKEYNLRKLQCQLWQGTVPGESLFGDIYLDLPYWYVELSQLWLEGYFPELADNERGEVPPGRSLRETIADRVARREKNDKLTRAPCHIIGRLLGATEDLPMRRHFIKFYCGWKEGLNSDPNYVDEIAMFLPCEQRPKRYPLLLPLNGIQWPSNGMMLKPNQLIKQLRSQERFPHLDELPDAPPLKVLRTTREIVQVAKDLDNCAAKSEIQDAVRSKRAILVAHYDEGCPEAKALGMFTYDPEHIAKEWFELMTQHYKDPTEEVKELYTRYKNTIHEWWSQFRKEDWFSDEDATIDWSNEEEVRKYIY